MRLRQLAEELALNAPLSPQLPSLSFRFMKTATNDLTRPQLDLDVEQGPLRIEFDLQDVGSLSGRLVQNDGFHVVSTLESGCDQLPGRLVIEVRQQQATGIRHVAGSPVRGACRRKRRRPRSLYESSHRTRTLDRLHDPTPDTTVINAGTWAVCGVVTLTLPREANFPGKRQQPHPHRDDAPGSGVGFEKVVQDRSGKVNRAGLRRASFPVRTSSHECG